MPFIWNKKVTPPTTIAQTVVVEQVAEIPEEVPDQIEIIQPIVETEDIRDQIEIIQPSVETEEIQEIIVAEEIQEEETE